MLEEGVKLDIQDWEGEYEERNNKSARENMHIVRAKKEEWVRAGHLVPVNREDLVCVNPLSVAEKQTADGPKFRPCLDVSRSLNLHMSVGKTKLDELGGILRVVKEGEFFASLDLSSAYLQVRIHPDYHKFLGICIPTEGGFFEYFQFIKMIFGLNVAVKVLSQLLAPIKATLNELGVWVSSFIDDFLTKDNCESVTWAGFQLLTFALQCAGWGIGWEKSSSAPSQVIEHLGFRLDSREFRVFAPTFKLHQLCEGIDNLCNREGGIVGKRELASVLGKICHLLQSHGDICKAGTRICQHVLGVHTRGSWGGTLLLTEDMRRELGFMKSVLFSHNGIRIRPVEGEITITQPAVQSVHFESERELVQAEAKIFASDASDAISYVFNCDQISEVLEFVFNKEEREASSGLRELYGLSKTLEEGGGVGWENRTVFWLTDSRNMQSFVKFGSRVPAIQRIVLDIKIREREGNFRVIPIWQPRSTAILELADLGSKLHSDSNEWGLGGRDFARICHYFGVKVHRDAMASHLNRKVGAFFSKLPCPESSGLDFFAQPATKGEVWWCCPPVGLIEEAWWRLIAIKQEALFCCPVWRSRRYWGAIKGSLREDWKVWTGKPRFRTDSASSFFNNSRSFEMIVIFMRFI